VLSALHARAFAGGEGLRPWAARLERHALTWIGAFEGDRLVGFVQVAWDGGGHAFVLDTVVDPVAQGSGIGSDLVAAATAEARTAGCHWLHVDFEDHLAGFYLDRAGFRPTAAGLIDLTACGGPGQQGTSPFQSQRGTVRPDGTTASAGE
jgi:ribosomal protein S18 acetylase RimI-like enzyme